MSLEGYNEKIQVGSKLLEIISSKYSTVNGIGKLKNKIKQEVSFLQKCLASGLLKKEHILCSNLHHYESLVQYLVDCPSCVAVLEVFQFTDDFGEKKRLTVDVVSEGKRKWTKVIARNPKALSIISKGDGEYGQKSVLDQAEEYVICAEQNLSFYVPPIVEFYFACGIENNLADTLKESGVSIGGFIINSCDGISSSVNLVKEVPLSPSQTTNKLNLDVSTMLAYVSAMTNGHAHIKLRSKILDEQAHWERERPIKPVLDQIFKGKELFCCESAVSSFSEILKTLGGVGEKERGKELLSRLTVVKDSYCPGLKARGQVKDRSLAVFGTGLEIKAITVTANAGFVRAAVNQGIVIPSIIHEPRALSEQKEIIGDSLQS